MKHTKGEWFVSGGNQIVSMPSQCKVAKVSGMTIPEMDANTRLIAAAPDMLDALQNICSLIKGDRNIRIDKQWDAFQKMKAAINKATS